MGKRSRQKKERKEKKERGEEVTIEKKKPQKGLAGFCLGIIRWGTYLALLTPLIYSRSFFFPFVAPKSLYFMGLALIIFSAWLVLIIHFPKYRPNWNSVLIALLLFFVVFALASVFGIDPSRSFWSNPERMTGVLMWIHLLAFFLVISSVFREKKDWLKIFSVSIVVALILSFIALFSENPSMKGGATIGNTSFLGTFLLFNIFFAFYLFLKTKDALKWIAGAALVIMLIALYSINARAAGLSVLGGFVLLFLLYFAFAFPKRIFNVLARIGLVAVLVFILAGAFFVFQEGNAIHDWFVERATYARLVVWEGSWQGFLERPLLGWGPENFDSVFSRHFNPCMFLRECGGEVWFDKAHNIVFDLLVTVGAIGFLAYLWIFISVFFTLWKNYFQKRIDFWLTGIVSVTLIAYFIQNLTVFDMVSSYLMFMVTLGFVVNMVPQKEKEEVEKKEMGDVAKKTLSIVVLVLFVFSFVSFVINPAKTDYYVINSLRAEPFSNERLGLYEKTLRTSSLGKYQIRNFFASNLISFIRTEEIEEERLPGLVAELEFLSNEIEESIQASPLDLRSHLRLGEIYTNWGLIDPGKFALADRVLEKAIEISPTNQHGYWSLAQSKVYQDDAERAMSLIEKSIELDPRVFESHFIAIQIANLMRDQDLVKEKVERALQINPQWEDDIKRVIGD